MMYRRIESGLPPDASYPEDLTKLGYFLKDDNYIRSLNDPEKGFEYFITNDERHNDVNKEALNGWIRGEILRRLLKLNIGPIYLPTLSEAKPPDVPSIPVLMTPKGQLVHCRRVFILVNDPNQDLGILAYRLSTREAGIKEASVIELIETIQGQFRDMPVFKKVVVDEELKADFESGDLETFSKPAERFSTAEEEQEPGVIIMNPGQRYFSHKHHEAMSVETWQCLTRRSALHPAAIIDDDENLLDGHRTPKEHIDTVLETLVNNPEYVGEDAKIYFIALDQSIDHLYEILEENWESKYCHRVAAIVTTRGFTKPFEFKDPAFKTFVAQRCRSWIPSPTHPMDAVLAIPDKPPRMTWYPLDPDFEGPLVPEAWSLDTSPNEKMRTYLKVLRKEGLSESAIEVSPTKSDNGSLVLKGGKMSSDEDLDGPSNGRSSTATPTAEEFTEKYLTPIRQKEQSVPWSEYLNAPRRAESDVFKPTAIENAMSELAIAQPVPIRGSGRTSTLDIQDMTLAEEFQSAGLKSAQGGKLTEILVPRKYTEPDRVYRDSADDKLYCKLEVDCPTFSGGDCWYPEVILPLNLGIMVKWFSEVAMDDDVNGYKNPAPDSWTLTLDEYIAPDEDDWNSVHDYSSPSDGGDRSPTPPKDPDHGSSPPSPPKDRDIGSSSEKDSKSSGVKGASKNDSSDNDAGNKDSKEGSQHSHATQPLKMLDGPANGKKARKPQKPKQKGRTQERWESTWRGALEKEKRAVMGALEKLRIARGRCTCRRDPQAQAELDEKMKKAYELEKRLYQIGKRTERKVHVAHLLYHDRNEFARRFGQIMVELHRELETVRV